MPGGPGEKGGGEGGGGKGGGEGGEGHVSSTSDTPAVIICRPQPLSRWSS